MSTEVKPSSSEQLQNKPREIVADRSQFPENHVVNKNSFINIKLDDNGLPIILSSDQPVGGSLILRRTGGVTNLDVTQGPDHRVSVNQGYIHSSDGANIIRGIGDAISFKTDKGEVAYYIDNTGQKEMKLIRDDVLFRKEISKEIEFELTDKDPLSFEFMGAVFGLDGLISRETFKSDGKNKIFINHPSFKPENLEISVENKKAKIKNSGEMKVYQQREGDRTNLIQSVGVEGLEMMDKDLIIFEGVPVGLRVEKVKKALIGNKIHLKFKPVDLSEGFPQKSELKSVEEPVVSEPSIFSSLFNELSEPSVEPEVVAEVGKGFYLFEEDGKLVQKSKEGHYDKRPILEFNQTQDGFEIGEVAKFYEEGDYSVQVLNKKGLVKKEKEDGLSENKKVNVGETVVIRSGEGQKIYRVIDSLGELRLDSEFVLPRTVVFEKKDEEVTKIIKVKDGEISIEPYYDGVRKDKESMEIVVSSSYDDKYFNVHTKGNPKELKITSVDERYAGTYKFPIKLEFNNQTMWMVKSRRGVELVTPAIFESSFQIKGVKERVDRVKEKIGEVNWNFSATEFLKKPGVETTLNEIGKFYNTSIKPRGWKDAVMMAARLAVAPKGVTGMILGGLLMTANLGGIAIKEAKTLKKIRKELTDDVTTKDLLKKYFRQTSYGKLLEESLETKLTDKDRKTALLFGLIGATTTTIVTEIMARTLPSNAVTRSLIYRGISSYIFPSILGFVEKKTLSKDVGGEWDQARGDEWLASSMAVMSTTLTGLLTVSTVVGIAGSLGKLFSERALEQPVVITPTSTKEMATETLIATKTLEPTVTVGVTNTLVPSATFEASNTLEPTQTQEPTMIHTATAMVTPTVHLTDRPTTQATVQATITPPVINPPGEPDVQSPGVETPPVENPPQSIPNIPEQPLSVVDLHQQVTINGHQYESFDTDNNQVADKWIDNGGHTLVDAGNGFIKSVDAQGQAETYFLENKVVGATEVHTGFEPSSIDLDGDGQADLLVKNNHYYIDTDQNGELDINVDQPVEIQFRWNDEGDKQVIDVMEFQDGSMWRYSHTNSSGKPEYVGVLDDGRVLNMHSEEMPIAMLQKASYEKFGKYYSPQEVGREAFEYWRDNKGINWEDENMTVKEIARNQVGGIASNFSGTALGAVEPVVLEQPAPPVEVKEPISFENLALDAKGGPTGEIQGRLHQANPDLSANQVAHSAYTTYLRNQDQIGDNSLDKLGWSENKINHEINEGMVYDAVLEKFDRLNQVNGWGLSSQDLANSANNLINNRWQAKIPEDQIFHGTGSQPQYNQLLANIMDKDDEDEWNIFFEGFLKQIGVIK